MLTEVWIVHAFAGEYSDYREWDVAAYLTEDQAKLHAELANKAFADAKFEAMWDSDDWDLGYKFLAQFHLDSQAQHWVSGYKAPTYAYTKLSLFQHVDQFIEAREQETAI